MNCSRLASLGVPCLALVLSLSLSPACSSSSATPSSGADASAEAAPPPPVDAAVDSPAPAPPVDGAAVIADRPYTLHVPSSYDASKPTPLVVMFHGFGVRGATEEIYFQLAKSSDAHDFLYAYGDGLLDQDSNNYWNATDACCDLYHSGVDDVGYFDAIVADVAATHNVDKKRVYVIGHSNGGFMAHRLACERSTAVAAIVSLAGAVYGDATKCNPAAPVAIAEVHGDADMTIAYGGGMTKEGTYPSAHQTVATWAAKDGCTGALAATGMTLDLDANLAGNETKIEAYGGCPSGADVQLWTIQGGAHIPSMNKTNWGEAVWTFFSTHPRP